MKHKINEIIIFLNWKSSVDIRIVLNEGLFSDYTVGLKLSETIFKFLANLLCPLFTSSNTRMGFNLVSLLKICPRHLFLSLGIK